MRASMRSMTVPCTVHAEHAGTLTPPRFASWADFLARTPPSDIRHMCAKRTKKANAERLLSPAPEVRVTAVEVWHILATARGRCVHCGSLCVERLSYSADGKNLPWAHVGRRIGSLEHSQSRFGGGGNDRANLAWACLWCNTWGCERVRRALDHGGLYPPAEDDDPSAACMPPPWPVRERPSYDDELADAYGFVEEDDPWARNWL